MMRENTLFTWLYNFIAFKTLLLYCTLLRHFSSIITQYFFPTSEYKYDCIYKTVGHSNLFLFYLVHHIISVLKKFALSEKGKWSHTVKLLQT